MMKVALYSIGNLEIKVNIVTLQVCENSINRLYKNINLVVNVKKCYIVYKGLVFNAYCKIFLAIERGRGYEKEDDIKEENGNIIGNNRSDFFAILCVEYRGTQCDEVAESKNFHLYQSIWRNN